MSHYEKKSIYFVRNFVDLTQFPSVFLVYQHRFDLFLPLLIRHFFVDGKAILYNRNNKKTFRDTAHLFFFLVAGARKRLTMQHLPLITLH